MSVSLNDLKNHLRVTSDLEDDIIQVYLDAAIDFIELETGRNLTNAPRISFFDDFGALELVGDNPTNIVVKFFKYSCPSLSSVS